MEKTTLPSLFRRAGSSLGEHVSDLQHQIDRLFDDFSGHWNARNGDAKFWPALDMTETNDAVDVTAELPGIDPKDVDISVLGDTVTIKGEKKSEKESKEKDFYRSERSYGAFARSVELPFEIDASKVEASYDKGVLKLHITKPPGVRKEVKKISIRTAA